MTLKAAIAAIQKHGILLVYPINNKKYPLSLWSVFHPRTKMVWEWDESGDDRVARLWGLREELSRSGKVVYAKWYKNRATFFSKEVFTALLCLARNQQSVLSPSARNILETLSLDSPLSTKQLKRQTGLTGKVMERVYEKAMKELWQRLLIVGFGEVDEGAFPSLAIGSTQLLFEDLWNVSLEMTSEKAKAILVTQNVSTYLGTDVASLLP